MGQVAPGPCGTACSCLPSTSLLAGGNTEYRIEPINTGTCGEAGLSERSDKDGGSTGSDDSGSDTEPAVRLLLSRPRVFSPHTRSTFAEHYQVDRLLGEGSYGNVYEATSRTASGSSDAGRRVAAKCFPMQASTKRKDGEDEAAAQSRAAREMPKRRASFEQERGILAHLEHPHLIKMFECFEEQDSLWVVMEPCAGGELYECISNCVRQRGSGGVEEPRARIFFRQMVHAVGYLHASQIVHRDIKTENFLLLGKAGSENADVVKLCDFGTAVRLSPEQPRAMERIGTLSYTAPEVYNRLGATVLSDVWSLGVVLYVLLVGASPFRVTGEEPRQETVDRIAAGNFETARQAWRNLSAEAKELVHLFLVVNEAARLRCVEALRHPWVAPGSPPLPPRAAGAAAGAPPALRASPRLFFSPRAHEEERLADYAAHAMALVAWVVRFAQLDALQKVALTVCAQMLSEAELLGIAAPLPWYGLFFVLDADEDGRLDLLEFVEGMKALLGSSSAISSEHLMQLGRCLDIDGNGVIDWVEWMVLAVLSAQSLSQAAEPLTTLFRVLDRPSSDGVVGVADLLAIVHCTVDGQSCSSTRTREAACRVLSKWATTPAFAVAVPVDVAALAPVDLSGRPASSKERQRQRVPPSLALRDLKQVLAAATTDAGDSPCDAPPQRCGANWFGCCQAEAASPFLGQVLVEQRPAALGNF